MGPQSLGGFSLPDPALTITTLLVLEDSRAVSFTVHSSQFCTQGG